MSKGQIRSSTDTLLRRLAKDASSEKVRLEACRLLLMLEGKLSSEGQRPGSESASAKRVREHRARKANELKQASESKGESESLAKLAERIASESPANAG